jgi:hypothetical protein
LLKYCLTQLKHLDLGVMEKGVQLSATDENLEGAWNNIQVNQELEGVNYADMDPKLMPAWDPKVIASRKSS